MPTVFTHPAVPLALRALTGGAETSSRLVVAGALAAVLPDVDALGFFAGVPYGSLFGHRGFTHSLAFALLLAAFAIAFAERLRAGRAWTFAFVFLSTASHGVLDALTDGGLGVAFFSPFSERRYFLPWQPIPVSPIGVDGLLSADGVRLFAAELALVWLPCLLLAWAARALGAARATRLLGLLAVIAGALAGAYGAGAIARPSRARFPSPDGDPVRLASAIANLERQAGALAAQAGAACPADFSALDDGGRPLRISLFHGYEDHEGKVYDRIHSRALLQILRDPCRGPLSACGFSVVERSPSVTFLTKTLRDRRVNLNLFTSSLPEDERDARRPRADVREQDRLSRAVKERFYRELVDSDVVFYMGHSRLGGSIGFDHQAGFTTLVDSVLRRPLAPVLEALERRPTRLRILGLFSCRSERYFRRDFAAANPSLDLILTSGELRYGPGEQASFGALEAVLSLYCGRAFHESMIAADEPDPEMTRRFRGR